MEVRRVVLVEEHTHDDAEEPAELRHSKSLANRLRHLYLGCPGQPNPTSAVRSSGATNLGGARAAKSLILHEGPFEIGV
jgi:hypothetical protein